MLVVDRLSGILFQMQALDADCLGLAVELDFDLPFADHGLLVLRNLVALRQIRIEIVLPVEHAPQVDRRLQSEPSAHRLRHAFPVDHRQHPRHRRIDE